MNKRGQITIFIIVAMLLVVMIALFFIFRNSGGPIIKGEKPEKRAESYLESCIEDKTKDVVEILYRSGGYMENTLVRPYDGKNISYLCYNANYYYPCVNQEPMFLSHLKDEIRDAIAWDVRNCFDEFAADLGDSGYTVDANYNGFDLKLAPKKIVVEIDGEFTLTKSGETSKQEDFTIFVPTRIYDLALIVQEIVSQEAEYCNFDILGYMLLHTKIKVEKKMLGDQSKIYSVKDKNTEEEFWFAIRSCALPGGI